MPQPSLSAARLTHHECQLLPLQKTDQKRERPSPVSTRHATALEAAPGASAESRSSTIASSLAYRGDRRSHKRPTAGVLLGGARQSRPATVRTRGEGSADLGFEAPTDDVSSYSLAMHSTAGSDRGVGLTVLMSSSRSVDLSVSQCCPKGSSGYSVGFEVPGNGRLVNSETRHEIPETDLRSLAGDLCQAITHWRSPPFQPANRVR
jgi:hypothetical protein